LTWSLDHSLPRIQEISPRFRPFFIGFNKSLTFLPPLAFDSSPKSSARILIMHLEFGRALLHGHCLSSLRITTEPHMDEMIRIIFPLDRWKIFYGNGTT
jgi:hypothetical protein